jgi:AcrR family transcriptional regulator
MATIDTSTEALLARPKRADARRNYDKVLAAAREAFAEGGESTALEEIARRAGVGIGTLYRHFPTRQALLEAVYAEEIGRMADAARALADRDPWDALSTWLRAYVGFAATKKALTEALLDADPDSDVLLACRTALLEAGNELIARAQEAGVVRPDTTFTDVGRLISGVAVVPTIDDAQRERLIDLALDGLRYTP